MFKCILRNTLIFTVLFYLIYAGNLFAETPVKIAILPFSLDAGQTEDQLKSKIPLMISEQKQHAEVIGELFQQIIIKEIAIGGNKRVEADAIFQIIETQVGDIIKTENISKDLKNIYEMGYFDNIVVKKESIDNGVKIIFLLKEKSSIRKVEFKNNTIYEEKELIEVVKTKSGSILNFHMLNSDINQMRLMYTEKSYHHCIVTYEIIPQKYSQADIIFSFDEGEKIQVGEIIFDGNNHFSDKEIKKAMETSEKGFFSFLTSSGDLKEIEVNNDVIRIESLYKNNGFIDAKVSDPVIDFGEKLISIYFKIDEGAQYKISKIDINGDMILEKSEIFKVIQSKENQFYSREKLRKDILSITDIYANKGFANVNINPLVAKNDKENMMAITYSIKKGEPVYFNRINISGNLKTRDKVIRREIKIIEQDLYSKDNIQKSYKFLNRLDYFEKIDVTPVKTSDENIMDLDVSIVEKSTGTFSIGGGYSSTEGGFIGGEVQERNIFGRGQTVNLKAKISSESVVYNVGFFEPYIFDTAVSGGIQLYREDREYDYYDKESLGLTLRLGYRLFDYTSIGINYNIEDYEITNINPIYTNMKLGAYLTSSIKPYIQYDSRDDLFLPTEGAKHKFSVEYAGEALGGEIDYTKYLAEASLYFPLFWKFTGALHAAGGILEDRTSNDEIDIDFTRFYLGGMNSIRGFEKFDISGKRDTDEADENGNIPDRGGEKYVQFNAEVIFPFTDKYKLAGVFFYDRGDVYRTGEDIDLGDQYSSFGLGVRWNSPMGPLRIEYAWVIDGKDLKESGEGKFEFSVGASF